MKLYITYGYGYDQRNNFSVVEAEDVFACYEIIDRVAGSHYAFAYSETDFAGQVERWGLTEIPLQPQNRRFSIIIPNNLPDAIYHVWQQIGPDLMEGGMCHDNEEVVEACLDADRLDPTMGFNDDEAAFVAYRALVKAYGWRTVVKALAAHPKCRFI